MKTVGFVPYSTPFRWWNATNIAHNRIFARVLMALKEQGGYRTVVLNRLGKDRDTQDAMVYIDQVSDQVKTVKGLDALVLFCGPFFPLTLDSLAWFALNTVREFEGVMIFVTCDYLLQFDARVSRYGKVLEGWPEDALTKNKEWKYILHGGFAHHFRTPAQEKNVLSFVDRKDFIEVPLNMSGIPPNWVDYKVNPKPGFDLLYAGAFRPGRVRFFNKYFSSPQARGGWYVSSSDEGRKKFSKLPGFSAQTIGPISGHLWKQLNNSWAQIIFSDEVDVKCRGTPLPTRYWEAVAANSVVFFDEESRLWADASGVSINYVDGPEGLKDQIVKLKASPKYRLSILEKQREAIKKFDVWRDWQVVEWFRK